MKTLLGLLGLVGFLIVFAGVQGCGRTKDEITPDMAYGKAGDPLPAGAREMDFDTFFNMHANDELRVTNNAQEIEAADLAASDVANATEFVTAKAAQSPGLKALLDASASMTSATVEGTVPLTFRGKDGKLHTVKLLSAGDRMKGIARAIELFGDHSNQVRLYSLMHGSLSPGRSGFYPSPASVVNAADQDIRQLTKRMAAEAASAPQRTASAGAPANTVLASAPSCDGNEGDGLGTDRYEFGSNCPAPSPSGLFAAYNFPLRQHVSCVKDQANRGTCIVFATVGALETEVSLQFGRKVNLAEQALYARSKNIWEVSSYGDGLSPDDVWTQMRNSGFIVPFEKSWNYNRSYSRTGDDTTRTYQHSCDGYTETCSETTHQSGLFCATNEGLLYCGYASLENPEKKGFRVSNVTELWDSDDTSASVNAIVAAVAKKPVTLGIDVPPSFDGPDANGFVTYVQNDGKSRGGHGVEVVGAISNATLAAILPTAPAGDGGGYLIIKNSWSVCWADSGFVYVPYSWVKRFSWSAVVLNELVAE